MTSNESFLKFVGGPLKAAVTWRSLFKDCSGCGSESRPQPASPSCRWSPPTRPPLCGPSSSPGRPDPRTRASGVRDRERERERGYIRAEVLGLRGKETERGRQNSK